MKPIKLLVVLFFVLAFAGCEIVVTDDLTSYETRSYTTFNLEEIQLCSIYGYSGDFRDVNFNSCGSWNFIGSYSYMQYKFTPSQVTETDYDGYSSVVTKFDVYSVYAFNYGGDIFIYYDIGNGEGFEYNFTMEEVGYYDGKGYVDFYR